MDLFFKNAIFREADGANLAMNSTELDHLVRDDDNSATNKLLIVGIGFYMFLIAVFYFCVGRHILFKRPDVVDQSNQRQGLNDAPVTDVLEPEVSNPASFPVFYLNARGTYEDDTNAPPPYKWEDLPPSYDDVVQVTADSATEIEEQPSWTK